MESEGASEAPASEEPDGEMLSTATLLRDLALLGIRVEFAPEADEDEVRPLLERLHASQHEDSAQMSGEELIAFVRKAREAGLMIPEAEAQPEEDDEGFPDAPIFDPLALGIQLAEALLTEAKAGFIAGRIEELEAITDQEFDPSMKTRIADLAALIRDDAGLPDVPAAYRKVIGA